MLRFYHFDCLLRNLLLRQLADDFAAPVDDEDLRSPAHAAQRQPLLIGRWHEQELAGFRHQARLRGAGVENLDAYAADDGAVELLRHFADTTRHNANGYHEPSSWRSLIPLSRS